MKTDDIDDERAEEGWNEEHAAFLAEYASIIERDGVALEEFRTFLRG